MDTLETLEIIAFCLTVLFTFHLLSKQSKEIRLFGFSLMGILITISFVIFAHKFTTNGQMIELQFKVQKLNDGVITDERLRDPLWITAPFGPVLKSNVNHYVNEIHSLINGNHEISGNETTLRIIIAILNNKMESKKEVPELKVYAVSLDPQEWIGSLSIEYLNTFTEIVKRKGKVERLYIIPNNLFPDSLLNNNSFVSDEAFDTDSLYSLPTNCKDTLMARHIYFPENSNYLQNHYKDQITCLIVTKDKYESFKRLKENQENYEILIVKDDNKYILGVEKLDKVAKFYFSETEIIILMNRFNKLVRGTNAHVVKFLTKSSVLKEIQTSDTYNNPIE